MIKKRIAIFFIFLANLILLAHITMPHHHHEGEVCLLDSHCETDACSNSSDNEENKAQGNNDNECCLLAKVIIVPSNLIRHFNLSDIEDDKTSIYDFYYLSENTKLIIHNPEYKRNIVPLIRSSYSQFTNISIGLRAPPIV